MADEADRDQPLSSEAGDSAKLRELVAALERELTRREQEMQRRLRNMLAMIRAIVRKTGEEVDALDDYRARLEGRIAAFTRAQSMLLPDVGAGIDLFSIVADEVLLAGLDGDMIQCEGESVRVSARAANLLVLLVHELVRIAAAQSDEMEAGPIATLTQHEDGEGDARLLHIAWSQHWTGQEEDSSALRWLEGALAYELEASASLGPTETGNCRRYSMPARTVLASEASAV